MMLGAHQPNFLPWCGYLHKLLVCDRFVLADDVQFTSQSYTNRTRIRAMHGPRWLSVPVLTSGRSGQAIRDVRIDTSRNWRRKQWKTLRLSYAGAPFFERYADAVDRLYNTRWTHLIDLNLAGLTVLREALKISTPVVRSSRLDLNLETSTERIISMVKTLGCDRYMSGRGGSLDYLDRDRFEAAGIDLVFDDFAHPRYPQRGDTFVPGLSAIDLLFNAGPRAADMLRGIPIATPTHEDA